MNAERKPGWWYPYIFVGAFALVLLVNATMAWFAVSTFPGLETEKHYDKGLKYNQNLAAAQAQAELGWSVSISAARIEGDRVRVEALYKDRQGAGIEGLGIRAYAIRPAQPGQDREAEMVPLGGGRYAAEIDLPLRGQWDIRLAAIGKDLQHQTQERIDLR